MTPTSYEEDISYKQSSKWIAAMKDEMNSLCKNETRNVVEKPKDYKLIDCGFIRLKKMSQNQIIGDIRQGL